MCWTTPEALTGQLQRLWRQGVLLRELIECSGRFPLRLTLNKPTSQDLSSRFTEVRQWIAALQSAEQKGYRIEWKTVRHRVIGSNRLPVRIWVDSAQTAINLLKLQPQALEYQRLVTEINARQPALVPWLIKYPLRTLDQAPDWPRFLSIIEWLQHHPRPDIYLRQIDLPEINSKFIERQRGILGELLDLTLPPEVIDPQASGIRQFNRRFGFRDRPVRVRYRIAGEETSDQEIDSRAFASLNPTPCTLFVIENEISYLAFPAPTGAMVIFGRGYGFDMLASALWMQSKRLYYWGDIDTHGLAILNQFRQLFPRTQSLMMDEETLLAHQYAWGKEEKPCLRQLAKLTAHEQRLYQRLTEKVPVPDTTIRLEQEHIAEGWIRQRIEELPISTSSFN